MSTKAVANQPKVARAASILIRALMLTVREAMLAAEFSVAEASMKWLQRKVTRSLPLKTKHGLKHNQRSEDEGLGQNSTRGYGATNVCKVDQ